uniref:ESAG5-like n=1 Tax=Trypanosoma vivax (strain Y486) TaxID=1055687 RepID=G0W2W3_TRYVY|nr:ESAG5-like [Trypanosoma vivax Y486]
MLQSFCVQLCLVVLVVCLLYGLLNATVSYVCPDTASFSLARLPALVLKLLNFTINEPLIEHLTLEILAAFNKHSISFSAPKQAVSVPLVVGIATSEVHLEGLYIEGMKVKMSDANKLEVSIRSVTAIVPETNYTATIPKAGIDFLLGLFTQLASTASFVVSRPTPIPLSSSTFWMIPATNQRLMLETSVQLGVLNLGVCSDDSSLRGRVSTLMLELSFLIAGIAQSIIPERVKSVVVMVNDILGTSPIVAAELRDENAHMADSTIILAVSTATEMLRATEEDASHEYSQFRNDFFVTASLAGLNNVLDFILSKSTVSLSVSIPAAHNSSLLENVYPNVYNLCPGCLLELVFTPSGSVCPEPMGKDGISVFCIDVPVGLAMLSGGAAVHDVLSLRLNVTAGVAGLTLEQGNRVRFTLARVVFTVNVLTSAIETPHAESLEGSMRPFSRSVVLPHFNNHIKSISIPFNTSNLCSSVSRTYG